MNVKKIIFLLLVLVSVISCDKNCNRGVLVWYYNATEFDVSVNSDLGTLNIKPNTQTSYDTFPIRTIESEIVIHKPGDEIIRYDTVQVNDCGTLFRVIKI